MRPEEGIDSLELELGVTVRAVSCSMCVLGTEHDSSARAFSSGPKLKSSYECILVSFKLYFILN